MRPLLKQFYFALVFVLLATACGDDSDPAPALTACIELPETSPKVNEAVSFTSCSNRATSFLWAFGDGSTSTLENPEHTYTQAGDYTVTLTITDDGNGTHSTSETLTVAAADGQTGSDCQSHPLGFMTQSQTWAKGCHIVKGWIQVENGATLTIEPGAVVKFEPGAYIGISADEAGAIIAEGTATEPILFTSAKASGAAPGDWDGFHINGTTSPNSSIFKYCTFEYGGLDMFDDPTAMLRVVDGGKVKIDHCEFRYGNSYALSADAYSGFEQFTNNYIHDINDFAMLITGNYAGTIGEGNQINNKGVLIDIDNVTMNTEWRGLTCPYVTASNLWVGSETGNTLTLGAGVRIEFQNTQMLLPTNNSSTATIIANGTAENPVVFTAHDPNATSRWGGIKLGNQFPDSYFQHTIFEKAQSGATQNSVIAVGAITVNMENCSISGSKAYGVYIGPGGTLGTFQNNDFGELAAFSMYIQMQNLEKIGANTFSGGKDVDLGFHELITDVVFPELPVYYHVDGDLWLGSETGNTVTFSAGSKFLMVAKTIMVGQSYPIGSGSVPTTFHAVGTAEKPIIIKRVESGYSSGSVIDFSGSGIGPESIMEYCNVIGGSIGIRVDNLYNDGGSPFPTIRNCTVSNCSSYPIRVANSNPLIENNTYTNNGTNEVYVQ